MTKFFVNLTMVLGSKYKLKRKTTTAKVYLRIIR